MQTPQSKPLEAALKRSNRTLGHEKSYNADIRERPTKVSTSAGGQHRKSQEIRAKYYSHKDYVMRLHEILNEAEYGDGAIGIPGEVAPEFNAVSPGITAFKQLRNTDSYMQYRMGVAMAAASSDQPFDQESAYAENFLVSTYTPEELEIMNKAAKLMNVRPTTLTSKRSQEPPNTNKASVVAAPKRNRYGV